MINTTYLYTSIILVQDHGRIHRLSQVFSSGCKCWLHGTSQEEQYCLPYLCTRQVILKPAKYIVGQPIDWHFKYCQGILLTWLQDEVKFQYLQRQEIFSRKEIIAGENDFIIASQFPCLLVYFLQHIHSMFSGDILAMVN